MIGRRCAGWPFSDMCLPGGLGWGTARGAPTMQRTFDPPRSERPFRATYTRHLQGLRHPRHRAFHPERRSGPGPGPGLWHGRPCRRADHRGGGARWPPVRPCDVSGADPGAGRGGHRGDRRGPGTTPMLYFAASTLCTSGIQVTGSHNPKDYNGFKMVLNGRAIYGDEIQALRRTMEADELATAARRQRAPGRCAECLPRAHRGRREAGAPHEDRGGQRQRHCRRLGAGPSSARWAAR